MKHPDFYSIKEVAILLGISRQAVRKQILTGKLEAYTVGGFNIIPINQLIIKEQNNASNDA